MTKREEAFKEAFEMLYKAGLEESKTYSYGHYSFREYQKQAAVTAEYPNRGDNIYYTTLGLCGEAGEFADKVKKIMRDHGGVITDEMRLALKKELGDVLWYVSTCCDELGYTMEEVASGNIAKLAARKAQNTIHGSGDDR